MTGTYSFADFEGEIQTELRSLLSHGEQWSKGVLNVQFLCLLCVGESPLKIRASVPARLSVCLSNLSV